MKALTMNLYPTILYYTKQKHDAKIKNSQNRNPVNANAQPKKPNVNTAKGKLYAQSQSLLFLPV